MPRFDRFVLGAALSVSVLWPAGAMDRFVSPAGSDAANDCSVSTAPCASVVAAVAAAGSGDTIRIAGGSYKESIDISGPGAVVLVIEGGWNGAFTVHDPLATPTTLTRNKDRVLTVNSAGPGDAKTVTVSDLIVHASKPKGADFDNERSGGAVLAQAIGTGDVILTFTRINFNENKSSKDAGTFRIATTAGGSLTFALNQCDVSLSKAKGEGGVMEVDAYEFSQISIAVADSSFTSNTSKDEGGVFDVEAWDYSTVTVGIHRSTFNGNSAKHDGGALRLAGYNLSHVSLAPMTGSAFVGNSTKEDGGALAVEAGDSATVTVEVAGSTFSANSAKLGGGGVHLESTSPTALLNATITNDILWGNNGGDGDDLYVGGLGGVTTVSYCNYGAVSGPAAYGSGNLSVNPMLGPDAIHLPAGSPMIDAGTCAGTGGSNDIDDQARPGANGPNPSACDIGADEY